MSKKEIFLISFGVFLTIVAWLIADFYHISHTEKIKPKVQISKYINHKTIDIKFFAILKEKKY